MGGEYSEYLTVAKLHYVTDLLLIVPPQHYTSAAQGAHLTLPSDRTSAGKLREICLEQISEEGSVCSQYMSRHV